MAYIPHTYVPLSSPKKKSVDYTMPSGGVKLSGSDITIPSGKCASLKNLDIISDRIKTREVFPGASVFMTGELHGISNEFFMESIVFHVGTSLYYIMSGEEEVHLISDSLPDKKSLICVFLSKAYIYCGSHVYSLDSNFNLTDEITSAPQIYVTANPNTLDDLKRSDVPFNLCAPRITFRIDNTAGANINMPHGIDTTRPIEVYENDVLTDTSEYSVSEERVHFINHGSLSLRDVKVVYYLLRAEEAGFDYSLSNSNIGVAFGGNSNGGTRLFFMGNSNKPGYYYKSELLNPLYVSEKEYEIIADGCENITAVRKMYGDLIVFTERSVWKMGYNFTQDNTYFTVKEISNETGCDCPGSVQLIDNRVVFANSKKGVFIVDSTEDTGEQNIKPLSESILKGGGTGLLDNEKGVLTKATSCDCDRKYMLFAGGKAYIWDYNATPFRQSSDYRAAQERLCWYIYDDFGEGNFFNLDGKFVSFVEGESGVNAVFYSKGTGREMQSLFESGNSECFYPLTRKHITDMTVKLCRGDGCELHLTLYGDSEKYYETVFPQKRKDKEKIRFHLPQKALYDFAFSISGKGEYEIEEITADFIMISE